MLVCMITPLHLKSRLQIIIRESRAHMMVWCPKLLTLTFLINNTIASGTDCISMLACARWSGLPYHWLPEPCSASPFKSSTIHWRCSFHPVGRTTDKAFDCDSNPGALGLKTVMLQAVLRFEHAQCSDLRKRLWRLGCTVDKLVRTEELRREQVRSKNSKYISKKKLPCERACSCYNKWATNIEAMKGTLPKPKISPPKMLGDVVIKDNRSDIPICTKDVEADPTCNINRWGVTKPALNSIEQHWASGAMVGACYRGDCNVLNRNTKNCVEHVTIIWRAKMRRTRRSHLTGTQKSWLQRFRS